MPNYKKSFKNKFILNGVEIENVSIGASAIGKFEEPLDEMGLHLPFTIQNYEYPMRGLLQIISEDYKGNEIEVSYIILSDKVEEGSKYGEWKHSMRVMEYSGKYDNYLYHTFTYTKALKNNNPAPFEFLNSTFFGNTLGGSNIYDISVFLKPLLVKSTYFSGETITIPKVDEVLQGTFIAEPFRMLYGNTTAFVIIDSDLTKKHTISSTAYSFTLDEGNHYIDYGFVTLPTDADPVGGVEELVYRFFIKVIPSIGLTLLDAINIIRDSKPFETKKYHTSTRLFNIDENLEPFLASVEMPQMFLQKATMRQILNTMFSYINAISRFTYNENGLDVLSYDEFNKLVGTFDIKDIISYSSSQEATGLFNQGVTWAERILPTSFEEETIISPAENLYKTVRSSQVQLLDTKFELPLDSELYQPVQFKHKLNNFTVSPDTFAEVTQTFTDYELDLTARLINREEWFLKEYTVDFPEPYVNDIFDNNVGFRENRVSNLYWQQGAKSINLSEVVGETLQQNIVFSTIHEGFNEYITRNYGEIITPYIYYSNVAMANVLVTRYEIVSNPSSSSSYLDDTVYRNLRFQLKYITFDSFPFQSHRENVENSMYYTEGRLNQSDKALNISFASLRAHGDTQRSGVPSITFSKIYEDYDDILRWGMIDENDFVIVEEKFEYHNDYVLATYTATKDHNRLSLWTKVDQEYRWNEIPRTNQVFERQELFNENVVIYTPNDNYIEEDTLIQDNALDLIFGTLMNDWKDSVTNGKTKVTLARVRTDGFLEIYPDENDYYNFILVPVRSFGGKHGFSFVFGFDGNQVASNQIEELTNTSPATNTYWNKAVRYTNENGEFTQMWFSLATQFAQDETYNDGFTEEERMASYPLSRIYFDSAQLESDYVTHQSGLMLPSSDDYNPLMFGKKDKSQSVTLAIQTSVFSNDYKQYVLGNSFFSENFIVNNPYVDFDDVVGTPMYLYIYTNGTTYGKFDTFKVKNGYASSTLLESGTNVSFSFGEFRFSGISLTSATSWAIGDELGNLYMACNFNYNGFNAVRHHFYPNQKGIGNVENEIIEIFKRVTIVAELSIGLAIDFDYAVGPILAFNLDSQFAMASNLAYTRTRDIGMVLGATIGLGATFDYGRDNQVSLGINSGMGLGISFDFGRDNQVSTSLNSGMGLIAGLGYTIIYAKTSAPSISNKSVTDDKDWIGSNATYWNAQSTSNRTTLAYMPSADSYAIGFALRISDFDNPGVYVYFVCVKTGDKVRWQVTNNDASSVTLYGKVGSASYQSLGTLAGGATSSTFTRDIATGGDNTIYVYSIATGEMQSSVTSL